MLLMLTVSDFGNSVWISICMYERPHTHNFVCVCERERERERERGTNLKSVLHANEIGDRETAWGGAGLKADGRR